ncbi:transposable element P transposase [Elysia marginata]|uniref:Transposable element P transposase n=1 Tax=Elysia marginata TaxID=1093978 RepID=A0AAV4I755_9GAST|nr:transposable element P transposase [Elysia marginata]
MEEIVRHTSTVNVEDKKLAFLRRAIMLLNSKKNSRIYSVIDLTLAFSWVSKSRVLTQHLRECLQLPSLNTILKLTSIARNLEDSSLFQSVFSSVEDRQRGCILIIDEGYVKASITYRGGTLFGHAVDCPNEPATTVLSVMVKCLFGGKTFVAKLLPCWALESEFQFHIVENVIMELERCGATVIALINDNNRVNQSFF